MAADLISLLKINAVIDKVNSVFDADSPFEDVKVVLLQLRAVLQIHETRINRAIALGDREIIDSTSRLINQKILHILPILGMIIRSTNVRNSFEILEPLQDLSRAFLGRKSRVLVSSEWDYIPFAYPQTISDLPAFTFIGLPASESGNLLILPLAGHELGHSIWRNKSLSDDVYDQVLNAVNAVYNESGSKRYKEANSTYRENDLMGERAKEDSIRDSVKIALAHLEEVFCDLFALAIFGDSYLRAFSYILSPGIGSQREAYYPTHVKRAEILIYCAKEKLGIRPITKFVDEFSQDDPTWDARFGFAVRVAEQVAEPLFLKMWDRADELVRNAKITLPNNDRMLKIFKRLGMELPSADALCLGDIVNASWARFDELSAAGLKFDRYKIKIEELNEMGLKTVEALEFRLRTSIVDSQLEASRKAHSGR